MSTYHKIPDLAVHSTYDDATYLETWQTGWPRSKRMLITKLSEGEETLRVDADDAIIAGAGLDVGGGYATDETSSYLKAADFATAGITANLKNADLLLDAEIAAMNLNVSGFNSVLTTATIQVKAADMKNISSIPFVLITHQDDKFIDVLHCSAFLDYGGTPFNFSSHLSIAYNTLTDPPTDGEFMKLAEAWAEAGADTLAIAERTAYGTIDKDTDVVITTATDSAVGNSVVYIYLVYRIITLP
jgi:hypothetical protein